MTDQKPSERLAGVHPQMIAASLRPDRKILADLRPVIGQLVDRALALAGISKQEAAYAMDYRDAGTISRWCSGSERPCFDKLFSLDGFEAAYILAMAERNPNIEATTVITIRRKVA